MHNLTGLLLLAIACYGVLAQDQVDVKTIIKDCLQEHAVEPRELEAFRSGALKAADAKDNLKCAKQCMLLKMGIIDGNSKFMPDGLRKLFADKGMQDKVERVITSCQDFNGPSPCDTAFQIGTCIRDMKLDS